MLLRFFIIFLLNFQYISNIQVLNQTGNEDLCYYNFLCAHPLGLLSGTRNTKRNIFKKNELKILEWWISRFMRDPLFFLISRLYPEKCIKFNKSEPINLIFCAPFKIIYRKGRDSLNFEKTGFLSLSTISMKERFKKKIRGLSIGYSD